MRKSICLTLIFSLGFGLAFAGVPTLLPGGATQTLMTASPGQNLQSLDENVFSGTFCTYF